MNSFGQFLNPNIDPRLLQAMGGGVGGMAQPQLPPQMTPQGLPPPQGVMPQMPPNIDMPGVMVGGQPVAGPIASTLPQPPIVPQAGEPDLGQLLAGMMKPGATQPDVSATPTDTAMSAQSSGPPNAVSAASPPAATPSLWDKLMSDDNFRAALMRTGLQMMQPIQPGQTPLGHSANAITGGLDYLQSARARQKQDELAKQKLGLETRQVGAQETTAAATATRAQETPSERDLRSAQAAEAKARAALYERSTGRGQATKLPATREDFLKQASLKAFSEFSTPEDIMNVMQAAEIAADRIYGAAGAKASASASAGEVPPAAQRVVGHVYKTPKGDLRWTGTGWLPQ